MKLEVKLTIKLTQTKQNKSKLAKINQSELQNELKLTKTSQNQPKTNIETNKNYV